MANARKVQVVTPASPAYGDAARRRQLADAIQQQAMAPRDMSFMQGADPYLSGMTQLGQALLARYAGKNAAKAEAGADSQMRDVNAQAIEKLAGAYQIEGLAGEPATPLLGGSLPGSQIDTALKGMDPRQANQVVSQALLAKVIPKEPKQTVLPYGSKIVDEKGNVIAGNDRLAGAPATSGDMQWLTTYMEKNPGASFADAAKAHAEYKRSMQPERPPDPVTLATVDAPGKAAGVIKDARTGRVIGDAVPPTPKAADTSKSNQKVGAIEAAKVALDRVQNSSNTLGSGGGFIEGRLPAMGEKTQDYDGAVAQLLAALQSAIRVPGIGSQSNMELQALMKALPLRTQEKSVRDNQITGIQQRLGEILSREVAAQDGAPGAPAAINSAEGGLSPAEQAELDALRKRFGKQ